MRIGTCAHEITRRYVHLLEDNALGVRRALERAVLEDSAEGILLPGLVRPLVIAAVAAELTSSVKTAGLAGT